MLKALRPNADRNIASYSSHLRSPEAELRTDHITARGPASVRLSVAALIAVLASLVLAPAAQAAPVADDVSASTPAAVPVVVTLSAAEAFDSPTFTFEIVQAPAHGQLGAISAPSCTYPSGQTHCTATVEYRPDYGFRGQDQFEYQASYGSTTSAPATVTVDVTGELPAAPGVAASYVATVGAAWVAQATGVGAGATIDYGDGSGLQPLPAGADGTAALAHSYAAEGDYLLRVTNYGPAGQSSSQGFVRVLPPGAASLAQLQVPPGQGGTLLVDPGAPTSLSATLVSGGGGSGVSLVGGTYPSGGILFSGGPAGAFLAGYDLRALGTGADDRLSVVFSYPASELPPDSALYFYDPGSGAFRPVVGSVLASPSMVIDPIAHQITVIFDRTSTPTLTALTGTRLVVLLHGAPRLKLRGLSTRRLHADRRGRLELDLLLSQRAVVRISIFGIHTRRRPQTFLRTVAGGRQHLFLPLRLQAARYRIQLNAQAAGGRSPTVRASFRLAG
jgi:hypothetical protein